MTVRELVGGDVVSIDPTEKLARAAQLMRAAEVGSLAVTVGGHLDGIITERDIVDACAAGADFTVAEVEDWMTPYPDTFHPDMSVDYAATWMAVAGYRHIPVVENDRPIGIVSIKDVLWALTGPTVS